MPTYKVKYLFMVVGMEQPEAKSFTIKAASESQAVDLAASILYPTDPFMKEASKKHITVEQLQDE